MGEKNKKNRRNIRFKWKNGRNKMSLDEIKVKRVENRPMNRLI